MQCRSMERLKDRWREKWAKHRVVEIKKSKVLLKPLSKIHQLPKCKNSAQFLDGKAHSLVKISLTNAKIEPWTIDNEWTDTVFDISYRRWIFWRELLPSRNGRTTDASIRHSRHYDVSYLKAKSHLCSQFYKAPAAMNQILDETAKTFRIPGHVEFFKGHGGLEYIVW